MYAAYICPPSPFVVKDFSLFIEVHWWGFCGSDWDKMLGTLALKQMPSGPCVVKCAKNQ